MKSFLLMFFAAMLAILNPVGIMPLFLAKTATCTDGVRKGMAVLMGIAIFVMLFATFIAGNAVLEIFSISIPAFRIAGGIIVILIGLEMIMGKKTDQVQNKVDKHLLKVQSIKDDIKEAKAKFSEILVPIGIPIFVGPGTMTTVIIYTHEAPNTELMMLMPVILALSALIVTIVLYYSGLLSKFLGKDGMDVVTRIMGLVLLSIGIQFCLDGCAGATIGIFNATVAG